MNTEIKTESPQERPTNPIIRWAFKNRLIRRFLFDGPFPDEIEQIEQGAERFSRRLLGELKVMDHPIFQSRRIEDPFINQLTANIIDNVFSRTADETLDGKPHPISHEMEITFLFKFSRAANISYGTCDGDEEYNRQMDLETRFILLTILTPSLKRKGYLALFIEDLISEIHGRRADRYSLYADTEVTEAVSYRLDKLNDQLEKINPNQSS